MDNEIEKSFTEIPATEEQLRTLALLADAAKTYTDMLRTWCPPGRERAVAETNVEQAAMWAAKAVTHAKPPQ